MSCSTWGPAAAGGLALAVALGACTTTDHAQMEEAQLAREGRQLAETYCASCHDIDEGTSPHPDAPSFARAANRYPPDMLGEAFAEGIQVGHPDMPVFEMDVPNIERLTAYLRTLRDEDG
ncbi:hypothetical protein B5C34_04520 [Pacificimonas flava]|uniref:Cytochrome c domain-containing protein n=2 Tax=Pacificimonas TaxID=1960290 RepID=A0A219B4T2_9SPHN|nr:MULTISPECIES: cytochrome c [Pacificimonas]MBZ6377518.1 cytochrome c [Pacificimonas aurantium]OWV32788.1 hypothetical protein B5C34_04520 [Pacificimonas flava]